MKKIAIITTGLEKVLAGKKCGGGEILLKNLIIELSKINDISLSVFTPFSNEIDESLTSKYPSVDFRSYNQSPSSYKYIDELKQIFKKENFDVIINSNMVVPYETTFLQSHSYLHKLNKAFILFRPVKKYLLRHKITIQKNAFLRAVNDSCYIAVSNIIKDDYRKNFNIPNEKIKVIFPGTAISDFEEIKQKNILTFGIVANSSINKGGHYLLFALGILNLLGRKFKLRIIAPKFKKDLLMRLIILLFGLKNKVEALPFQNNMADFYNNIDVLVLPSLNEAFGLVTLEAMAHGIPCLVSSTAGSAELINKDNGVVFNRNSFWDFIKKLNNFINLYNKNFEHFKMMSSASRQTAEKCSWKKFALKVIGENE